MIKIKRLQRKDLLQKSDKQELNETIDQLIRKLCLLYTKSATEDFKATYNKIEQEELKKINISKLLKYDDFKRDMIDFFIWGLNTTNIIGNCPRKILELYFFNKKFCKYVNETLYTSQFITIPATGSGKWNLGELTDSLNSKLGISKKSEIYTQERAKIDLLVYKQEGCREEYNKVPQAASTGEIEVSLINHPDITIKIDGKYAILDKKFTDNKDFILYTIDDKYNVQFCQKINLPYPDVFKYEINVESLNNRYFGGFIEDSEDE